jgi:RHS repeat-associated protein
LDNDTWLPSRQKFFAGAIPLDRDGNPVHGQTVEWSTSDNQIVFISKGGRGIAAHPGAATLTARAGNKQESVRVNVYETGRESSTGISLSDKRAVSRRSLARLGKEKQAFAHAPMPVGPNDPLPDGETNSLYEPRNDVGNPEGRTEAGAMSPSPATDGTETPSSANYTFNVGLLGIPGRQMSASLGLTYNSRVWHKVTNATEKLYFDVDSSWPAPGFRLGYGQVEYQGTAGFTLTEPDGTRRKLTTNGAYGYQTTDGSMITYYGSQFGGNLLYPDGTQVYYAYANGPRTYPAYITDRHGNVMNIYYAGNSGPKITFIEDTLDRFIRFYYSGNDLIAITAPGYNGGSDRQVARFYYETLNLQASSLFQTSTVQVSSPTSTRILRYLYLPGTQNGYRYDYSPYGMIHKSYQLRGMTVDTTSLTSMGSVTSDGDVAATSTYNYPLTAQSLIDVPKYSTRTDDWAGRTTASPPVWTFSADETTGTSTVTAPDNTVTETLTELETGQLQSVSIKYGGAPPLAKLAYFWEPSTGGKRLTKLETTNDAQQTRVTTFTYDAATIFNNVTIVSERDFASPGTLGTELRRLETTYENSSNYINMGLLHLPRTMKVFAGGSSTPASLVTYAYDGGTLLDRPGIVMHNATYNPYSEPEMECEWVNWNEYECHEVPVYNSATAYRGNLTSVTTYANAAAQTGARTDSMAYDIAGNVVEQTANCCRKKAYGYSDAYGFAYQTSQTRGESGQLSSSTTYDLNTGLVRTAVSENNRTTTIHYDPASLRTSEILRPEGATATASTTFIYYDRLFNDPDAMHKHSYVLTTTQRDSGGSSLSSYQSLDGRGAVARSFDNLTLGVWVTRDSEYDELGRPTKSSQPYSSSGIGSSLAGDWITRTFDRLNRIKSITSPSGDSSPTTSTATVDYAGTVTTSTDPALRQRRQVTDALGRLLYLDEPDISANLGDVSAPAQRTAYEYDSLDNLTKVTQGSQIRQFKYDSLSQLTQEKQIEANATLNDTGTYVGTGSGSWTGVFVYNNFGLMTDSYDARGVRTQLVYDTLNRLKSISNSGESAQTPTVTYTYGDEIAPTPPADSKGQLYKVETAAVGSTPTTAQEFDYSVAGRIVTQRQKIGATTYTLGYAYNYLGQITSCTHPSGRVISYGFDAAARLISVGDSANRISASGFAYAAHGGLTAETWGNGAVENVSYNRSLQPKTLSLTKSGEVQKFEYKYGVVDINNGNVDESKNSGQIGRVEGFIGPTASPVKQWQQRYTYDSVNRLSKAREIRGDNGTQAWHVAYTHDRWGNRFQSGSDNSGVGYTNVVTADVNPAKNQLISTGSTPTTYDDAGQITSDSKFRGMQYQYDANGRMRWAGRLDGTGGSSSVYDGGGQRVQTVLNSVTRHFVYNLAGQTIAEYRQGVLDREYVYQGGALLATDEQPRICSVTTDQFVQAFYIGVLNRQPNATELSQKSAALNQAMAQGYGPLLAQAQSLGTELFTSQEYLNRNRTNAEFITDLYWGYLQRAPDQSGYNWWLGILNSGLPNTRGTVRHAFEICDDFQTLVAGNCATSVGAATVKYVFSDSQGSTRALLDGNGNVLVRHDYLPSGEELWAGIGMRTGAQKFGAMDQSRSRYGLTAKDEATGLDHTWFRKYEGNSGRWTTPDPSGGAIGNPQSFNRYAYALNDPSNLIDPSGLIPCEPGNYSAECDASAIAFWGGGFDMNAHRSFINDTGIDIIMQRFLERVAYLAVWRTKEYETDDPQYGLVSYSWWDKSEIPQARFIRDPFGAVVKSPAQAQASTRATQPVAPTAPAEPPCATSPYINFAFSGGLAFFSGNAALLASNRGIYLQFGGSTAFGPGVSNGRFVSPLKTMSNPGGSFSVRASRSGITPGVANGVDAGIYALSVAPNRNASHEFGPMIGVPTFSQPTTYTFRILNQNGCPTAR